MNKNIRIVMATLKDIPQLVYLRRIMFESMGFTDNQKLDLSDKACEEYLKNAIEDKKFIGWLATINTQAVASGGVIMDQHAPSPGNLSGKIGYILNIVTLPKFRRKGIARKMMHTILEWTKKQGITRTELHATDMGLPLYQQLGFKESRGMRLDL
jgi:GNAT superfamily N-acetyltransferase